MNIKFIEYDGISDYARVMYHDVEESDKYRIDITYNGKDVKALLEYLFDTENEVKRLNKSLDVATEMINNKQKEIVRLNNIINEVRKYANKYNDKIQKDILEILDKGEENE